MLYFDHAYQKLIKHLKTMQNILILLCQCINLLEYSDNYSIKSGSLWDYYRDEVNNDENEIHDSNVRINNKKQEQLNLLNIRQK